ncbi:hypothetical protein C8R47DRAFT_1230393 [Mycena vitilis]|nr:hypothetical protein C8R47DRAFT_1230393 [Mycena vitilis]
MALLAVLHKGISASLAGFALAFSNTVQELVTLEQAMASTYLSVFAFFRLREAAAVRGSCHLEALEDSGHG